MTKLSGMGKFLSVLVLAAGLPFAQAQSPATIHGHVQNAAGQPLKGAAVKLTLDKSDNKNKDYKFSFPTDANGDYKGTGVTPGDYLGVVVAEGKTVDFLEVTVKAGDDKLLDFDMTRPEFMKGLSAEDKAAVEELKKKNAAAMAENSKIANINKVLVQALEDQKNGKPDVAVAELKPLIDLRPNEPIVWSGLASAELAQGGALAKAAGNTKPVVTDPAAVASYTDSAAHYQKAIDLASLPTAKPNPDNMGAYYLNMGQALSKIGKLDEAGAAYEQSAKVSPARASTAFYNEAVIFYQGNKLKEAGGAADKAIAADPKHADAYYIKAQSMVQQDGAVKEDPATHKFTLPPGCLEAYQEYLELDPNGAHAKDVKELLEGLGQPVKNTFKATKPH